MSPVSQKCFATVLLVNYSLSFYIVRVLDSDRKLEEILLESKLISLAQHRQKCDSPAELNLIFLKKECANFNVG